MMPTTRSGGMADDSTVNFASQMDNYMKSSEIFKAVIIDALTSVVSEALNPLQAEMLSLKSEVHSLRDQLTQVKAQANDNEQYSRRNNVRIFGLLEVLNENCYDIVLDLCQELKIQ